MKFTDMCEALTSGKEKIAYNTEYPELFTNIRMHDTGRTSAMMYYFTADAPNVPVVITPEIWNSDGWEFVDDWSKRLNIQEFMRMPHAKEFIKELNDTINSEWNGRFTKEFACKEGYEFRMREAIALGLIFGNKRSGRLYFTDLGEDLIKTL